MVPVEILFTEVLVEDVLVYLADVFLEFVGFRVINLLGVMIRSRSFLFP